MKTTLRALVVGLAILASVHHALAQNPVITSFSQNGVLVCSNLSPGSVAAVQWASSPAGPWQTNWDSLAAITVGTNKSIQVSVPMFYRVVGVAATNQPPPGMGLIPAGSFTIGNSIGDVDIADASPVAVNVSAFYMDLNLVTSNQWRSVYAYATNHGYTLYRGLGKAADHPVQSVDWFDCVKWCNARSQQAGLAPVYYTDASLTQVFTNGDFGTTVYPNWAAKGYRLPTEAEWEKAARGGLSGQRFPWGPTNLISQSLANYFSAPAFDSFDLGPKGYNTGYTNGFVSPYTSPVGSFAPNGYGLFDMAGNVNEWCWDWYAGPTYPAGSPYLGGTDPRGPASGTERIMRGGSWIDRAGFARCAFRNHYFPQNAPAERGLRCVRTP
jgi:formylglycine-generating enzyme required for sulfatase activity